MESDTLGLAQVLRIAVGFVALAILLPAGSAGAATVNASGGADYNKIQDAIRLLQLWLLELLVSCWWLLCFWFRIERANNLLPLVFFNFIWWGHGREIEL